jgi:HSP20 family molecular chaperone IbpA
MFADVVESALDGAADLLPDAPPRTGKLPVEVKLHEDGVIVQYDLPPGVSAEDVKVTLEGTLLEVTVDRKVNDDSEFAYTDRKSSFQRGIILDSEKLYEPVSASVNDGVLEVALSSRDRVTRHSIPVK